MMVRSSILLGTLAAGVCLGGSGETTWGGTPAEIAWETDSIRYAISASGKNASLRDKRSGKEYCARPGHDAIVAIRKGSAWHEPSACSYAEGKLTVQFAQPGVTVVIQVLCKKQYLIFEVQSVSDSEVDELVLPRLAVTCAKYRSGMSGLAADDEFAMCLRTLNLQSLGTVGGNPPVLSSSCLRKYGLAGAKIALVGCPAAEIRSVLKQLVREEGLPQSSLGGPFALDAPEARGSYLFAYVSEKNVNEWIELAKLSGMATIHLIGWEQSLGHYEPRRDLFPRGLEGLKAVVERIHAAGLKAGMHTLTGCIAPHDPWVTPVPDRRLAVDATFTLAAALDEKQTTLTTTEKPEDLDTMWAYSSRGNVLRIDDELIQYTALVQTPPFGFSGCQRGAFGTKPAPHAQGSPVHHLFVRYGTFLPDEASTLVEEVAGRIAQVVNTCGFDMIYMDGAEGMAGGWHGVAKMREAIFRALRRPVLVEASEWGYPSWTFHSRIGAWDYPNWGLKRFVDVHCRDLVVQRQSTLLPYQLGWWVIFGPNNDRPAETPDEIEYLCTKALAYDAPISLEEVEVGPRPANARQNEYLATIGRYERLRRSAYFAESVKQRLRAEREDFRLEQAPDGAWQFVPVDYSSHKVTGLEDGSTKWVVHNRFGAQPLKVRIEALYCVEPYETATALTLAHFTKADEFSVRTAAPQSVHALEPSGEEVKAGNASGRYRAKNGGASRQGAWTQVAKRFNPPLDVQSYEALGFWIRGDGKGELVNVQLTNPPQFWTTYDEHYLTVDFQGWRYVELLLRERDAERFGDYVWPYGDIYSVYRSPLIRSHLSQLSLYYNNLPPGDEVTCYFSPIKALRCVKGKLGHPTLSVADKKILFPVDLESGSSIECDSPETCRLYDERGALVKTFQPQGEWPSLASGKNDLAFWCTPPEKLRARAKITVIATGPAIRNPPSK